jgi:Tfp pilus assembly protein PilF
VPDYTIDQLKLIEVRPLWRKALLIVPVAAALFLTWHAVRWCLGKSIAESARDVETARMALNLAPDDPQAQYTLAVLNNRSFLPAETAESLRYYEQAAALSPHDFRLWLELGSARERAGDVAGAERALRQAAQLAPNYAIPRWILGNVLLRQEKWDEAFAELRRAGDADPTLRPQVFNLAWRVYGENVQAVTAAVGNSGAARAQLAQYLVAQKRVDDAVRLWASLSADEKLAQRATGDGLLKTLFEKHQYHQALNVFKDISENNAPGVEIGHLVNGGFENEVGPPGTNLFDWQVVQVPQTQMRLDAVVSAGGKRSLRIIFNAPSALDFKNVSQFVAVEPGASYRLDFVVRTEDLKGSSTLQTVVVDAANPNRILAASDPAPNGSNEWRPVNVQFTAPLGTEGITIRLARPQCLAAVCPVFGKVWYDDFNLQRVGGSGGGGQPRAADGNAGQQQQSVNAR